MNTFESLRLQTKLTETQAWQQLKSLVIQIKESSVLELFERDEKRAERFSLKVDDLFLDYSKNLITPDIMDALKALAASRNVIRASKQLFSGGKLNTTEDRAAWHTALRQVHSPLAQELPAEVRETLLESYQHMEHWVHALRAGYVGASGKPIRHLVHIGIGGSDLGPRLLYDALKPYHQSDLDIHFVSNIDPQELHEVLEHCVPEHTMFLLASKSFSTSETLENAKLAKKWLMQSVSADALNSHFIALTTNASAALAWGVHSEHVLTFPDWVGGRFSVWSPMALAVACKIGMDSFKSFLEGGYEMDRHFREAPLAQNMPVILALLGIWYQNFLKCSTYAVLPYDHRLRLLPDYLQQLDMESNGKCVQHYGDEVDYATAPILWGQAGTNGQHAFYQLLHQGTHEVPLDFILTAQAEHDESNQHQLLLANALAQTRALMIGQKGDPHQTMEGSKPSNTLVLKALTPRALGMLLALYEHKIFVQGVIWNINSFDQPGVELGKKLAKEVAGCMHDSVTTKLDSSTNQLIALLKSFDAN